MKPAEVIDLLKSNGFSFERRGSKLFASKNGIVTRVNESNSTAPYQREAISSLIRRANRINPPKITARLRHDQIKLGLKVKSRIEFVNVPKGSTGVVDELYDTGFMVRWNLPHLLNPIRDGFDTHRELIFLEVA